jgi:lysophospholipase L1-like esterase
MANNTVPTKNTGDTLTAAEINDIATKANTKQEPLGFTPENVTNKGAANGYAALDGTGKVPATQLPTGGGDGGDVSGLAPKDILYGKADGTIEQNANLQYDPVTNTFSIGVVNENLSSYTLVSFGDSVVRGSTLPDFSYRFTKLVADGLGLSEDNHGADGAQMVGVDTSAIPAKTSTMKYLLIAYGVNDAHNGGTTSTAFNTAYTAFLDAAIAKGWAGNQLLLISINGVGIGYNDLTKAQSFNTVISNLATTYGALYINIFDPLADTDNGGPDYLSGDGLHPNINGAKVTSYVILNAINKPNFVFTDQKAAINGKAEFTNISLKNPKLLAKGRVLVMDDAGNIGFALNVPVQFLKGQYVLDGSIVQAGSILPVGFDNTKDFVLKYNTKLSAGTGDIKKGVIIPFTNTGAMEFRNYYGNGEIDFYVANGMDGSQLLAATISNLGILTVRGLSLGLAQLINCGDLASINLLDYGGTGGMNFKQGYNAGGFNWFVSEGTDRNFVLHMRIDPSGRVQIGKDVVDVPSAELAVDSTTTGFLTPRMTSTQRDAIVSPAEGLEIYNLTTHKKNFYNGTGWRECADVAVA